MARTGRPKRRWGWANPDKWKCPNCRSTRLTKNGSVGKDKRQKYLCLNCRKSTICPTKPK